MTVALIDNGSLVPAATGNLRVVAAELSVLIETTVHAVSWKHSDRIPLAALDGDSPGTTLVPFVRSQLALGERHFVFAPFFISAQGAIGSALRRRRLGRALGDLFLEPGREAHLGFRPERGGRKSVV